MDIYLWTLAGLLPGFQHWVFAPPDEGEVTMLVMAPSAGPLRTDLGDGMCGRHQEALWAVKLAVLDGVSVLILLYSTPACLLRPIFQLVLGPGAKQQCIPSDPNLTSCLLFTEPVLAICYFNEVLVLRFFFSKCGSVRLL